MIGQTRKTIHERYEDLAPKRMLEEPRDEWEEEFADAEAQQAASKFWDSFGAKRNHRNRVIRLLAEQAVKSKQAKDPFDE